MLKEIIRMLKSTDPNDRMDGVRRLGASGHPDALKILGSFYKQENDAEVKRLTAQVAKQLKSQQASTGDSVFEMRDERASAADVAAAKAELDRAMDAMLTFDNDKAWEHAQRAFQLNPDLVNDDFAVNLAADITGKDNASAVEALMGASGSVGMTDKPKRSGKQKNTPGSERVGWGKALLGVGLYGVLVALVSMTPFFLFASVMGALMSAIDPTLAPEMATAGGALIGIGIVAGGMILIGTIIGLFIQYGLVHFSATTFLGGNGYFTNLLYNMRIPLIAQLVVQSALVIFMMFTLFSSLGNIDPVEFEAAINTGDLTYVPGFEENINLINILNGINGLIGLGFLIWISMVIGKTYDFGGVKGCLSLVLSSVILAVGVCGCYFAAFMVLFSSAN
ncbi:MAG: HEAT repeat domain-containing protein [Anaerolineae bacterium]